MTGFKSAQRPPVTMSSSLPSSLRNVFSAHLLPTALACLLLVLPITTAFAEFGFFGTEAGVFGTEAVRLQKRSGADPPGQKWV